MATSASDAQVVHPFCIEHRETVEMSAPFERRSSAAWRVGTNGFPLLALRCARNVLDATDRRMPEAQVLAKWLSQNAAAFGLADAAVPDDDALYRAKRRGLAVQDWRKIDVALEDAGRCLLDRHDAPIDRWLAAITETLSLDPLEAEILALTAPPVFEIDREADFANANGDDLDRAVPFCPEMGACLCVNQLRGDANLLTRPLNRNCANVLHAEFTPNLMGVNGAVPKAKRGIGRDDR
jgi:hypothetical protein